MSKGNGERCWDSVITKACHVSGWRDIMSTSVLTMISGDITKLPVIGTMQ